MNAIPRGRSAGDYAAIIFSPFGETEDAFIADHRGAQYGPDQTGAPSRRQAVRHLTACWKLRKNCKTGREYLGHQSPCGSK